MSGFATLPDHKQPLSMVQYLRQAMKQRYNNVNHNVEAFDARGDALSYLSYVMTDEVGNAIELDTFTRLFVSVWEDCLAQGKHLAFTAPPGSGKSSIARSLLLRSIGMNNNLRTVITSADLSDSKNSVNLCRGIVLSQAYKDVFPGVTPDTERSMDSKGWKMGEWYLKTKGQKKDPTMRAWASQPKGESIRVDMLLADDIVTQKTFEGKVHDRIVKAFHTTWIEGRLSNGGWCCYLQNVRGSDDLLHQLRHSPKFCSVWVGVTPELDKMFVKVWNPPGRLSLRKKTKFPELEERESVGDAKVPAFYAEFPFPKREANGVQLWTKKRLLQMDATARRTMFELQGLNNDDLLFPSWVNRLKKNMTVADMLGGTEVNGQIVLTDNMRSPYMFVAGLDLSGAERRGTAFWVLARDADGNKYPVEHWLIKGDLEKVVDRIDDAWSRGLKFTLLQVENNGVQSAIVNVIRTLSKMKRYDWQGRVVPFHTGTNKHDLQVGLPSIDVEFKTHTIHWPADMANKGSNRGDTNIEKEIGECWTLFESVMGKITRDATKSTTPDSIMAFWFAFDAFMKVGFASRLTKPKTIERIKRKDLRL